MRSLRLALALCVLPAFAAEAPKLRLPDDVRPTSYAADLTLIPGEKTFSGVIDIDIDLAKPASLIWLNSTDLTIKQATIASEPAAIEPGDSDFVGLRAAKILAPGPARIHIVYQGKISEKSSAGIFQGLDGKQPYLFTQFETTDARRAFPCFDQPDFKTPWQITVHVPKEHAAVSNTSPVSEIDEPNGMKKVVFAPSRPLPSYLVAIAVGPFDFVDAGKAGKNHIPVRIVTPKGKADQAKYAAEVTATLIDRLESLAGDYLDAAERMTLLNDLTSLLNAGEIPQADVLAAAAAFAKAPERQIVGLAQGAIGGTRRFLPNDLLPNYARFVQKTFGTRANQLGWSAKPGEDTDTALLRASLVPFVASQGESAALRDEARGLTAEWLKTRKGIDSNMVGAVLATAAQSGDRVLLDTMTAELAKTTDRQQRGRILGAMSSFRNPTIAQTAMDMVIHSEIDIRESLSLLVGPLGARETEKLPFQFVKANYDELLKHLPTGGGFDAGAMLPFVAGNACDESSRQEFVSFFEERAKKFTGGPHNYDQVLESIRLCEAQKAARAADIAAFFAKQ
jgi:aminopeptidase N